MLSTAHAGACALAATDCHTISRPSCSFPSFFLFSNLCQNSSPCHNLAISPIAHTTLPLWRRHVTCGRFPLAGWLGLWCCGVVVLGYVCAIVLCVVCFVYLYRPVVARASPINSHRRGGHRHRRHRSASRRPIVVQLLPLLQHLSSIRPFAPSVRLPIPSIPSSHPSTKPTCPSIPVFVSGFVPRDLSSQTARDANY
ncbi:hypothetical protein F5Y07DRAFT_56150 [Xylaria sp. FL0933]|nr:hypothetical protein F5Y07DRAFT_56150 [Xylaria sp. FL0933]